MTTFLEVKQKIKSFYGRYEIYIVPILKFILALISFVWINSTLGFTAALTNPFVVLILALLCSILPVNLILYLSFVLVIGHCYSVGIEVAAFALVLVLFLLILFLRFSSKMNVVMIFTPLAMGIHIPALLPIGSGLMSNPLAAIPAGCGVIFYYFVELVQEQATVLQNQDTEMLQKIKLLSDGLIRNQEMWITVVAFVAVILIVYGIRTRFFDYAWRASIVAGGVTYIFLMLMGSLLLNVQNSILELAIFTVVAILIGILLELFVFGGDYTRTERLEYEDDEYYYYVKAVPKATVATSERNIKKINATPMEQEQTKKNGAEYVVAHGKEEWEPQAIVPPSREERREDHPDEISTERIDSSWQANGQNEEALPLEESMDVDFEKKLEESLKDL
ncbi:MAG TPA: hypothetical protein IAA11_02945 [Candidatus Blautia intestinigallinarum]|nr:hypothetical protein [Candidatus Blautia intestinigallinarum]